MDIKIGDILEMKKPHPCGCKNFLVTRIGMEFKMTCQGCEHQVILPCSKVVKNIKKVISNT